MAESITVADIVERTGLSERTVWRLIESKDIAPLSERRRRYGKRGSGGRPPLQFPPSVIERIRELYKLTSEECLTCGGQHDGSLDSMIQNHEASVGNLILRAYDSTESDEERAIWRKHFDARRETPVREAYRQFLAELRGLRGDEAAS